MNIEERLRDREQVLTAELERCDRELAQLQATQVDMTRRRWMVNGALLEVRELMTPTQELVP